MPQLVGRGNYVINTISSAGNLNAYNNDNLSFRCSEDASGNLSFFVDDLTTSTTGSVTGTITAGTATANYITFHNIDTGNWNTSLLSNVVITSLGPVGSLPTATALTVSSSGTLDLNGVSQQVASLSGSGTVGNSFNRLAVLSVAATSATSSTFSGTIRDGLGTTALTVGNNETLVLSGSNTYSGTTSINGGTLQANNASGALGSGNITFGGGVLQFTAAMPARTGRGSHTAPAPSRLTRIIAP